MSPKVEAGYCKETLVRINDYNLSTERQVGKGCLEEDLMEAKNISNIYKNLLFGIFLKSKILLFYL